MKWFPESAKEGEMDKTSVKKRPHLRVHLYYRNRLNSPHCNAIDMIKNLFSYLFLYEKILTLYYVKRLQYD